MQVNGMSDWIKAGSLATFTLVALVGLATEIIRFCQAGF